MNHSEPFRVIWCDFVDRFHKSGKERSTKGHETARVLTSIHHPSHGRGSNTDIDGADSRDDQRHHPVIAALLERLKQPKYLPNAEEAKFVHDGKVEIKVWLSDKSDSVVAKLKELGFELVLDPKTSKLLVGRIPLAALQKLIELKEVRFVAPQY